MPRSKVRPVPVFVVTFSRHGLSATSSPLPFPEAVLHVASLLLLEYDKGRAIPPAMAFQILPAGPDPAPASVKAGK